MKGGNILLFLILNHIIFATHGLFSRFDQNTFSIKEKKTDPTRRTYESPGATVIQMLLAAEEGDVQFLKRYSKTFFYLIRLLITKFIFINTF